MAKEPRMLVITPSRGRPAQLRRLAEAYKVTCQGGTSLVVGLDEDDPALSTYLAFYRESGGWRPVVGKRRSLTGWTNHLARQSLGGDYDFFASLGDDHLPITPGWDVKLMAAAQATGGPAIAYGNDLIMGKNLPTAPVISTAIVRALGWMCLPQLSHYCVDNVWLDVGEGAGCLTYCDYVVVEHLHPVSGKASVDATYTDAGGFTTDHPDYAAYLDWKANGAPADIATVKALRSA